MVEEDTERSGVSAVSYTHLDVYKRQVSVGHRYWCLSVLASYGIKCDIPEDEVLTDALELLPMFDDISDDEHNRFTKRLSLIHI